MYKNIAKTLFVLLLVLKVSACGNRQNKAVEPTEDLTAKHDLQGIWLDEDGEDVAFRVKGDSIYFPIRQVYLRISASRTTRLCS